MHTLLDYDCLLPEFVNITDGKRSDNKATFDIEIKPHKFRSLGISGVIKKECTYHVVKKDLFISV